MSNKKTFIFTDSDLDGAGSYLMYKWMTGEDVPYCTTRVNDLARAVKTWSENNNIEDFDQIYVFDLDSAQDDETREYLDRENVTIIDHHLHHFNNKHKYKKANVHIEVYSSCTKFLYKFFPDAKDKLTPEQKLLVAMIDDYDCYELKFPESYHMNIVFWNYQGDRLAKFLSDFSSGFSKFKDIQLSAIDYYKRKLNKIKDTVHVYIAHIPIKGKEYKFVSTFASDCINEIAEFIIKNYKSDVGLVINTNSQKVSIRRSKTCDLDLSNFAEKLFAQGGGHVDAAGGILDDRFATFSKLFKPFGKPFKQIQ